MIATAPEIPRSLRLFNACALRPKESARANYAADLHAALRNEIAEPEDAREFFQITHATDSLRSICRSVFRRFSEGDDSDEPSIYRLSTGFGGGKTHTLIALAAAALHPQLIREGNTPVPAEYAPDEPIRIVAFTGENTDLARGALLGRDEQGDVRAKSLIGHIAYGLGGREALERFRQYDEELYSPGSEDIEALLGDGPCLILIDEAVQWLRRMSEQSRYREKLSNVATLFSSLAKAVENRPRAFMAITSPEAGSDAYRDASQQMLQAFSEIESITSRTSVDTIPSTSADLPAILRSRLFADIDEDARDKASEIYAGLFDRAKAYIAPTPTGRNNRQWFYDHYPFHPDTLTIITERLAANGNFQRVRGTLALLAASLHHLRDSDYADEALLVHPHHIDPDSGDVQGVILNRINMEEYLPAVKADVTDDDSTANRLDETRPSKPARRIARAALVASLVPVDTARGLRELELTQATLTPFDADPSVISNAITEFRNRALYVSDDPGDAAIRFSTAPNLNRMLLEQRNAISASEVNVGIRKAIDECFIMRRQRSGQFLRATVFPSSRNIPDEPDAVNLGVINYEWLTQSGAGLNAALSEFYAYKPSAGREAPREYKNNLLILVANEDANGDMEGNARRLLAAQRIKDSQFATLQDYQRESLNSELANAKRDLSAAIQGLYVNLYYPSTENAISPSARLQHIAMPQEVATTDVGNGQSAIIRTLLERRKLIGAENANLDPESYWKRRANLANGKVALASLRDEFARAPSNYTLLNRSVFDTLMRNALDADALVIKTGAGQIIMSGGDFVHSDDPNAEVYLRNNACPHCNEYEPDCGGKCQQKTKKVKEDEPEDNEYDPRKKRTDVEIPDYAPAVGAEPMNVLKQNIRRHMQEHSADAGDVESVILYGADAAFITFVASLLGNELDATATYSLSRGADFQMNVTGMSLRDWTGSIGRIASSAERGLKDGMPEAEVLIAGGDADAVNALFDKFPPSKEAGIKVTFRQRSEETSQ